MHWGVVRSWQGNSCLLYIPLPPRPPCTHTCAFPCLFIRLQPWMGQFAFEVLLPELGKPDVASIVLQGAWGEVLVKTWCGEQGGHNLCRVHGFCRILRVANFPPLCHCAFNSGRLWDISNWACLAPYHEKLQLLISSNHVSIEQARRSRQAWVFFWSVSNPWAITPPKIFS